MANLKRSVRIAALYLARTLGLFAIAQYLTRKRLRILCYHGFSLGDEYLVAPGMFMRRETFEGRMRILNKRGIRVVTLEDALHKLYSGGIKCAETVITLDDGWASNLSVAVPILEKFGYPACVYISTEHLNASPEVFNVTLFYMLYRSRGKTLTLAGVHPRLDGSYELDRDIEGRTIELIGAAEVAFPRLSERQLLLKPIAQALGMDIDQVLANGRFRLLDRGEIVELFRRGFDVQLHTHTHRLPDTNFEAMAEEIVRNREVINDIIGRIQIHLCYPSGKYQSHQLEWLERLGIASATTCDPGLNGPSTPVLLLKRYLDSDRSSNIEFEAEISGLRELARGVRAQLYRR